MEYRTLGRTGIETSLMSFGTGGPSQNSREALSAKEQNALIRRCLDLGINLFDTSVNYGRGEEILGNALVGVPRDSYTLSSKCVYFSKGELVADPEDLVKSVENSLRTLNTDHIEIMMLHGLMAEHYDDVMERYFPILERLREQGKIRFTGLSIRYIQDPTHEGALVALQNHPELWDVIMLKYGLLNQVAADEIFPLAQKHNVGIMNMAAVRIKLPDPQRLNKTVADWKARGLVANDAVPEENPLDWLIHDDVDSVISAGYKFAADHPAVGTVITGTANMEHLDSNVSALDIPHLSESDTERIKSLFGHIADYA